MADLDQFELVEDRGPLVSGFELRVNVAKYTSVRDGEVSITTGCATFGELDAEVTRLISELEKLRRAAEERFADGPFGPGPLNRKPE